MKTKLIIKLMLAGALLPGLFSLEPAFAQNAQEKFNQGLNDTAEGTGHTGLSNFQNAASLPATVGGIIKLLLSFLGVFFLILMIYGGYLWMTARGKDPQVEKARNVMQNAIIGLIIILVAYGITTFVTELVVNNFI